MKSPTHISASRSIAEASIKDIDTLSNLVRISFTDVAQRFGLTPENCPKHPSNCTPHWIARDMERGVRYFILNPSGNPIGCVGVEQASPGTCYMERLAVLPQYRGHGYGTILARYAMAQARSMGASRVEIGIIAADNGLKAFYTTLGFEEKQTATFAHLPFEVAFMSLVV